MKHILFGIIFISILAACSKPQAISQAEAEMLATDRMVEYVNKEKLSLSQFEKLDVRYLEKDVAGNNIDVWYIEYISKDEPIRYVSISIGRYRRAELHWEFRVEKPKDPPQEI